MRFTLDENELFEASMYDESLMAEIKQRGLETEYNLWIYLNIK